MVRMTRCEQVQHAHTSYIPFKVVNEVFRCHSGVQRSGWKTACCHRLARRIAPDVEDLLDACTKNNRRCEQACVAVMGLEIQVRTCDRWRFIRT